MQSTLERAWCEIRGSSHLASFWPYDSIKSMLRFLTLEVAPLVGRHHSIACSQ